MGYVIHVAWFVDRINLCDDYVIMDCGDFSKSIFLIYLKALQKTTMTSLWCIIH